MSAPRTLVKPTARALKMIPLTANYRTRITPQNYNNEIYYPHTSMKYQQLFVVGAASIYFLFKFIENIKSANFFLHQQQRQRGDDDSDCCWTRAPKKKRNACKWREEGKKNWGEACLAWLHGTMTTPRGLDWMAVVEAAVLSAMWVNVRCKTEESRWHTN